MTRRHLVAVALGMVACRSPEPPHGADAAVGGVPDAGSDALVDAAPDASAPDACVPLDCQQLGLACGTAVDGCGQPLECGVCCTGPLAESAHLEPGFPVTVPGIGGEGVWGPMIQSLPGDVTGDAKLEILVTGPGGPLWIISYDGQVITSLTVGAHALPAVGQVVTGGLGELVVNHFTRTDVYTDGVELAGWPVPTSNWEHTPPALVDIDGDGDLEIFKGSQSREVFGFESDGQPLPGFPVTLSGGQMVVSAPAVGDLDFDGDVDLVVSHYDELLVFETDGTLRPGFPVSLAETGGVDGPAAVGDVDGDGQYEIVVSTARRTVVVDASGGIKHVIVHPPTTNNISQPYAPVLADLDGDAVNEILVQTFDLVAVYRFDGATFVPVPGWPQATDINPGLNGEFLGSTSVVVGDVDGDPAPEIVVLALHANIPDEVRVYETDGTLAPCFPKTVELDYGATPSIADIDGDGRNEIVVEGEPVLGNVQVWVLDLGGEDHHPPLWGGYARDAQHTSFVPIGATPSSRP